MRTGERGLSDYREVSVLGRNHRVILAEHIKDQHLCIIKTLDVFDRSIYETLQTEQFPQIPRVLELIEDDGTLIVIEEYIEGESLEQKLDARCMNESETGLIILQLCGVLQPLHEHDPQIIHRDIKPSNLILSHGQLWLIDFDAARDVQPDRVRDTVLMGTEDYAAPEQFGFAQSTERTDIYAIGVVMNRMLTGKFPAEQLAQGKFKSIIRKCIAMDPKDRYPNVEALSRAVKHALGLITGEREEPMTVFSVLREIPGFRSQKRWLKIIAALAYLFTLSLIFTMEVTHKDGSAVGTAELVANRIALMLIIFGNVFYLGNFMGFRDCFPFHICERIPVEIGRIILGVAIIFFVPVIALVLIFPTF